MVEISAAMVKELRAATGSGIMDCKRVLAEAEGDYETAVDLLRKKGLAKAAKGLAGLPLKALSILIFIPAQSWVFLWK